MNNTDKLLRVFIEAQGFDIETTNDIKRTEITERQGHDFIEQHKYSGSDYTLENLAGKAEYKRGDNGSYFKILIKPIIDYKVTKKECEAARLLKLVILGDDEYDWYLSGDLSNEIKEFLNEKD